MKKKYFPTIIVLISLLSSSCSQQTTKSIHMRESETILSKEQNDPCIICLASSDFEKKILYHENPNTINQGYIVENQYYVFKKPCTCAYKVHPNCLLTLDTSKCPICRSVYEIKISASCKILKSCKFLKIFLYKFYKTYSKETIILLAGTSIISIISGTIVYVLDPEHFSFTRLLAINTLADLFMLIALPIEALIFAICSPDFETENVDNDSKFNNNIRKVFRDSLIKHTIKESYTSSELWNFCFNDKT